MRKINFIALLSIMILFIFAGCDGMKADKNYEDGKNLYDEGKFEESIEAYKNAIEFNPKNPKYYYKIAGCLKRLNKQSEAVNWYEKAIDVDENYIDAYEKLIQLHISLNNKDAAQKVADDALELFKDQESIDDINEALNPKPESDDDETTKTEENVEGDGSE